MPTKAKNVHIALDSWVSRIHVYLAIDKTKKINKMPIENVPLRSEIRCSFEVTLFVAKWLSSWNLGKLTVAVDFCSFLCYCIRVYVCAGLGRLLHIFRGQMLAVWILIVSSNGNGDLAQFSPQNLRLSERNMRTKSLCLKLICELLFNIFFHSRVRCIFKRPNPRGKRRPKEVVQH